MNNFDLEKELLIELEVKSILSIHFPDAYFTGSSYNFRCHICGDSQKSSTKKRGHIYTAYTPWIYKCYNGDCNAHMSVEKWLKTYFNFEYQKVMKELAKLKMSDRGMINVKSLKKRIEKIKIKKLKKKYNEKRDVSYFKSIKKYPNLIKYCKERLIPESVYSKWYYADGGFYNNRLIIPFFNDKDKIYYYQGRDMNKNSDCKYLSRMGQNLIPIYNYYNVDKTKPVMILEGPIDSIFIWNSIGMTGLKDKIEELKDFSFKYYLLDNDKSGREKSLTLLRNGVYVFNWKLFLRDYPCTANVKDVNDFIRFNKAGIRLLTFEILKKYFTNNSHHKIFFV